MQLRVPLWRHSQGRPTVVDVKLKVLVRQLVNYNLHQHGRHDVSSDKFVGPRRSPHMKVIASEQTRFTLQSSPQGVIRRRRKAVSHVTCGSRFYTSNRCILTRDIVDGGSGLRDPSMQHSQLH